MSVGSQLPAVGHSLRDAARMLIEASETNSFSVARHQIKLAIQAAQLADRKIDRAWSALGSTR